VKDSPTPVPTRKATAPTPEKHVAQEKLLPVATVVGSVSASRGSDLPINRVEGKYESIGKTTWMQYNDYYNLRLQKLRLPAMQEAHSRWSAQVGAQGFLPDLSGLSRGKFQEIVVTGVLFKDMPKRPNVVERYSTHQLYTIDHAELNKPLSSEEDTLWIEDAVMRIRLDVAQEFIDRMVTGLIIAVKGTLSEKGLFTVKDTVNDWCFPKQLLAKPLPATPVAASSSGPFLALASGFRFGAASAECATMRESALKFLLGQSEDAAMKALGLSVQRLIFCGGMLAPEEDLLKHDREQRTAEGSPQEDAAESASAASARSIRVRKNALRTADAFFSQVASALPVELMPGQEDPTNFSMPQEPMHPYLFTEVRKCKDFKAVRNPYEASVAGLNVLGHSGQPVRDILRCTRGITAIEALTKTFDAMHLAPTSPDTMPVQPFKDRDPFLIEQVPQLLFSGGHERAETLWRPAAATDAQSQAGTQLVCVPAFHRQPAVVLVNLSDPRDVRVQTFGAFEADGDTRMATA